ncbi:MAG: divalent metal cation transporter [Verrucomicrobiota bacterium]
MAHENAPAETEIAELQAAEGGGLGKRLAYYTRKSGPGWLQGAITLGGGSLAGALYLGVIMGYHMMWLQPFAMILGVIMLSAISYVVLTTGERPFGLVKEHVSPVLAWAWLIATMMANIIWCLPQFALGTAALQQNLMPGIPKAVAAGVLLIAGVVVVWSYNSGNKGIKFFELVLKIMVGIVVLSFFGVVVALTTQGQLDWGQVFGGFVPDLSLLSKPAPTLLPAIEATGANADYWTEKVSNLQRDKIITAFATAVGINMTFLLPYSMLRKGWGKAHRGLGIFDLAIGLIVPFVLATGCVVIAAASQFHATSDDVLQMVADEKGGKAVKSYSKIIDGLNSGLHADVVDPLKEAVKAAEESGDMLAIDEAKGALKDKMWELQSASAEGDRKIAAMLAERDNADLALTLEPIAGAWAQKVFGVGVLGMAISTIIILMLINGFATCEAVGADPRSNVFRIGSLIPAVGVVGPFVWAAAAPALATPTSVLGGAMLPIAYLTFLLLMNSKMLGADKPQGGRAVMLNVLMATATLIAGFASAWGLYNKGLPGQIGLGILAVLLVAGVAGFLAKQRG